MNNKPKIQENILKAGNIGYGRFRTAYNQLKQYYQEHPDKLEYIKNL